MEPVSALNSIPVQDVSAICCETAPLPGALSQPELDADSDTAASALAASNASDTAVSEQQQQQQLECKFADYTTNKEKFQAEISKWEEYYDQVLHSLSSQNSSGRNVPKSASHFSLSQDGQMYYAKVLKDGTVLYLKVIRDYAERVRLCREIHLDTGDITLHNRRDRMLELVGQMYFWKGQRRDVCQCIASCAVCSAGLGAKRKAKPPGQKRDIPRNGPPDPPKKKTKAENGPPDAPKKRGKVGRPRKSSQKVDNDLLIRNDQTTTMSSAAELAATLGGGGVDRERAGQQRSEFSVGGGRVTENVGESMFGTERSGSNTLDGTDISFQQIFTTIEDGTSDQNSPILQDSSQGGVTVVDQEVAEEGASIYELLFKQPSMPSNISPSVVEAVYMAMKHTPDNTVLLEGAESIMRQVLSLGQGYNVLVSPTTTSAYAVAIFASMLRMDPLSVSDQISSRVSSPLAVLHDACCAHHASSSSDLGPIKTSTALTGAYNWNLGDMTYPMDRDMVKMAVQSNRVAAVFYQPYAYIERCQHISLEVLSGVCHTRGCEVAVIVDATTMPSQQASTLAKLTAELKSFLERGADLVLMPSADRLRGHCSSCVLIGVSSLLSKVWRSIGLLQKQVCLPLLCLPHDLVGTLVTYKALQDSST